MVWLVVVILGLLVVGFAYAADQWKKRADFWEKAYLDKAVCLEALLDGIETYAGQPVNEGLLRVWSRSVAEEKQVLH